MLSVLTELLFLFLRSIALVSERWISSPSGPMDAVDMIGVVRTVSVTGWPGVGWNNLLYRSSGELDVSTSNGVMLNVSDGLFGDLVAPRGRGEIGYVARGEKRPERRWDVAGVVG